ncbi:MAG: sensor domain-containing diguanylate cyclase [Thermodesulfobacteriota bacterium]
MPSTILLLIVVVFAAAVALLALVGGRRLWKRPFPGEPPQDRMTRQQAAALREELSGLKKTLSRKAEIADRLPVIAKNLTERLPESAFPSILVRGAKELFGADQVGYFSPLEGSTDFTLAVGTGYPAEWQGKIRVAPDEGLLGLALQKKIVAARIDPLAGSGLRVSSRSLERIGIPPDFAAPIFGPTGINGVLVITGCPHSLEEERKYVSMLADLFSIAMEKAALADATRTGAWRDELTGVSTRLHFLQRFESEIRRTENYQQSFSLFMFDIDRFKTINDAYGHSVGDAVIQRVAEITKKYTRISDIVGRYGGDEFLVLITSTTREQALRYSENIRSRIAEDELRIQGVNDPVRLTISGGLAFFPIHGQTTTDLMQAADHALYEAKRKGRNRTVVAKVSSLADAVDGERTTPD